ncbi:MAG: amidohydrolase family protein [Actinomycetota bacterium]|nr:amidohydrolase family protein [Actinomycetota bacterium]
MIDGYRLIDTHLHAAKIPTLKEAWRSWADEFGDKEVASRVYDDEGTIRPGSFDEYLAEEGVDGALLLCEYSPKATGIQPIEDLLPIREANPNRIGIIGNVNPHLHYPIDEEFDRQLSFGIAALKLHPVHAGIAPNDRSLYPAYQRCVEEEIPLVVHCGTSTFPGSSHSFADPILLDDVTRDFPRLKIVLAHGGRGWWYDAAAFMALIKENVYIELSGLPPSRLKEYYKNHNFNRLARKMIFGTDWPGVPGIAKNARGVYGLIDDEGVRRLVLSENAESTYQLGPISPRM